MKQFYVCQMKYDLVSSHRVQDWIESDINTLIYDEAETILTCDDEYEDLPDDEFFALVDKLAKEIKDELMKNGIYRNEFGQPLFLYC
jgi:hypothetical protein